MIYKFEIKRTPIASVAEKVTTSGPEAVVNLMKREGITDAEREHLVVIHLDPRNQVRGYSVVAIGCGNCAHAEVGGSFREAIINGAVRVILAHNHPSGRIDPSSEDRHLTKAFVDAGDLLGISVLDHVIVGDDGYYSFQEHGAMPKGRQL